MRNLVLIGFLAVGGFVGYQQWMAHHTGDPTALAESGPAVKSPSQNAGKTKIICPTCEGEGRLSYVDGRGKNKTYTCQICQFVGHHEFVMPNGAHVCPDCKGMGKLESRSGIKKRIDSTRCARCSGQGYIVPRSGVGSRRPTPNVPRPTRQR